MDSATGKQLAKPKVKIGGGDGVVKDRSSKEIQAKAVDIKFLRTLGDL